MIQRDFFHQSPVICARNLIGCELHWGNCRAAIVETEAYAAIGDDACHTAFRPSARNFVDHHPAGTAYVYLNYGMYWLLNVLVKAPPKLDLKTIKRVAQITDNLGFVLIRALEPLEGIPEMFRRRGEKVSPYLLCAGPGRLTIALGIRQEDHMRDLCMDANHAFYPRAGKYKNLDTNPESIVVTPRIGIRKAADLLWRFTLEDCPYISKRGRS
jgi:DNA-3-methyladenine glycosylase